MNLENKRVLVAHGDSFTQGVGYPKKKRIDIENPWPKLLAKNLGMECVNLATEGISNEFIARDILLYLTDRDNNTDIFVIIGWTAIEREEFYNDKKNEWFTITNWGESYLKNYVTNLKTVENDFRKSMMSKIAIQNFLKINDIFYLFFDTFLLEKWMLNEKMGGHSFHSPFSIKELENKLIDHKLYCDNIFWEEIEKMGWDYSYMPEDGHPNERGHEFWANYLKEVISGNKT